MKLEYAGQNQDSGLHAKKSGVIFFKPKLLTWKHSGAKVGFFEDFLGRTQ